MFLLLSLDLQDYADDIKALKEEIEALKNKKSSGCGGSVVAATSAVATLGLAAVAVLFKKKISK